MEFNSTEHALTWFRDRNLEGSLVLKPSYQRNAVWMARQKCWLVESVLKGFPIPEVFINQVTSEDGTTEHSVVDGQQRIRTLLQFVGADADEDQIEYDKFALDKLEVTSPWYGKTFAELESVDKIAFYKYKLSVRNIESDNEPEMKEMFRRINTFTAPLKPQELRNATYAGPFAQLAIKLADDYGDFLAENRLISAVNIRRMGDIEFMAELIIGCMHGPQGGQASVIDTYYRQYEDYEEFPRERETRKLFARTMNEVESMVDDLRGSRWSNKTDFYSLFVAVASLIREGNLASSSSGKSQDALDRFAGDVGARIEFDDAHVSQPAADYAHNVIKGANDKGRRAARHTAIRSVLGA